MRDWLQDAFQNRPAWMNALMVFCAYMTFIYLPWDFFWKPVAEDQEVWFGYMFTGWAAKVMVLPHFFVYAAAAYGFRRRRPWMCTWAPVYVAQIAIGMLVWNVVHWGSWTGWLVGFLGAVPFILLAIALADAQEFFSDLRPTWRERYGEWAVVTGASAGIGAEFARALAKDGLSCVLAARREDRLCELAQELEQNHGVSTKVVAVDLGTEEGPARLADACAGLEIGVLVNNAGLGYAGRFEKQDEARLRNLVAVNCMAPVVLTSRFLPAMKERAKGAVIITGSVAGRQPLPLHGVYSATKAFDLLFGESLFVELRGSGIDVLVLEPGSTETEFQAVAGEIPHPGHSAESVVCTALRVLGDPPSVIAGWWNWLRASLAGRALPRTLVAYLARDVMQKQTPIEMR